MNLDNRTFVFYIEAKKPVNTLQLMFSENPDYEAAGKEVLADFDRYFPTATDRRIVKAQDYATYLKGVREADELNSYLNS